MTKLDLVCNQSSTKFWRAGYANLLLLVGAIFAVIVWEFLIEANLGWLTATIAVVGVLFAFVAYYSTFVSRVTEKSDSIQVLKAFTAIQIPIESITSIRISSLNLSRFGKITIQRSDGGRSIPLRLIAPITNIGTFDVTVTALENFAQRHHD